jgi:hypothetical protein
VKISPCLSYTVGGLPASADIEDLTTAREFLHGRDRIITSIRVERWRTQHIVAVPQVVTR